jgi:hypothetical protein
LDFRSKSSFERRWSGLDRVKERAGDFRVYAVADKGVDDVAQFAEASLRVLSRGVFAGVE